MKKNNLLTISFIVLILALIYLPILMITAYSFTDADMIGQSGALSLTNYRVLFSEEDLRAMIINTILLSLVVAALSSILGTLGAIGAFYGSRRRRSAYTAMNQIPVVNADVVTGFSICVLLIAFFGMEKDTYIPLVLSLTTLCAPFCYLSVLPRMQQMDPMIYEAALDLFCKPTAAMFRVILPQLATSIASGFMLSVTLVLDDYFITTYTKPATFDTISTYVVNATRGSDTTIKTALWALSAVIFVIVLIVVVLINVFEKKSLPIDGKVSAKPTDEV